MTTSADLIADTEAVIAYIEQHGWRQGALDWADGAVCLDGALFAVKTGSPRGGKNIQPEESVGYWRLRHALRDYLRGNAAGAFNGIVAWNDTPGRTQEEVVAMLRAFAASDVSVFDAYIASISAREEGRGSPEGARDA